MSMLKFATVAAVVCLLGTDLRADEKDHAKNIVGKWELTKIEGGGLPVGTLIEFTKDGKVKVTPKKGDTDVPEVSGTYKVDGDKLEVALKIGDDEQKHTITIVKLTDSELHTKNEQGNAAELTKKK